MATITFYIDVAYRDETEETFGPYSSAEFNAKWQELKRRTSEIRSIGERREIKE